MLSHLVDQAKSGSFGWFPGANEVGEEGGGWDVGKGHTAQCDAVIYNNKYVRGLCPPSWHNPTARPPWRGGSQT